jgi:hypothetical protein
VLTKYLATYFVLPSDFTRAIKDLRDIKDEPFNTSKKSINTPRSHKILKLQHINHVFPTCHLRLRRINTAHIQDEAIKVQYQISSYSHPSVGIRP